MTNKEFIESIAKLVKKYAPSYGIEVYSPIIAQAVLESNYGRSKLSSKYHNYFGLKCGTKWKGKSVNMTTNEEYSVGTLTSIRDNFRVYNSMDEGVKGYFEFIQLSRYKNLIGITDPRTYLQTIKNDGYATSSRYVDSNMKIITQYNLTQYDNPKDSSKGVISMSKIESAISWMERTANDNSHGYDQRYRWGEKGDYDCSAAVITAWTQAGVNVKGAGATYTGNMRGAFLRMGFTDITNKVNVRTGSGLKRGDVLLNTSHHTAMYCGKGKLVNASINEKGTAVGGKPGDQTGREFLIRSYYNYPWNCVLRYTAESSSTSSTTTTTSNKSTVLKKGSKGTAVRNMQSMLIALGYSCGSAGADGDFGTGTYNALMKFQKDQGLIADGEYGSQSKSRLTTVYNNRNKATNTTKSSGGLSKTPKWVGKSTVNGLNVRTWAGTNYSKLKSWPQLNKGNQFDVCDQVKGSDGYIWYYIRIANKYYGFVRSDYVSK